MTAALWSPQAVLDLQSIRDYIAHDSPRYATLVVQCCDVTQGRRHSPISTGSSRPPSGASARLRWSHVTGTLFRTRRIFADLTVTRDALRVVVHLGRKMSAPYFIKSGSSGNRVSHVVLVRTAEDLRTVMPFLPGSSSFARGGEATCAPSASPWWPCLSGRASPNTGRSWPPS